MKQSKYFHAITFLVRSLELAIELDCWKMAGWVWILLQYERRLQCYPNNPEHWKLQCCWFPEAHFHIFSWQLLHLTIVFPSSDTVAISLFRYRKESGINEKKSDSNPLFFKKLVFQWISSSCLSCSGVHLSIKVRGDEKHLSWLRLAPLSRWQ